MIQFLLLAGAYLLGGVPFGYLLVKWRTGEDVRAAGSGNIGATNVLRTTGSAMGIATLLLDIGKGFLAVWAMGRYAMPIFFCRYGAGLPEAILPTSCPPITIA